MTSLRQVATPLTIGSSLVLGVTGVLLFFHAGTGMNKVVHEWVGIAFIAIVGLHLLVNQRPFLNHFKKRSAQGIVALFAIILAASFLVPSSHGKGHGRPDMVAVRALENAPLGAVAAVLNENPVFLEERIQAAGFPSATTEDSILEIAGSDHGERMKILAVIFSQDTRPSRE